MVLREVREHGGREAHRVGAAERQRMRGDLHRARAIAALEHRAEVALQVDRLGGRARDRPLASADDRLDGAQQRALLAARLQQLAQQVCGRRLAVRASDARDAQLRRGVAVEARPQRRHRRARRVDAHLRHAQRQRPLDDERRRAVGDGLRRVVVPVAAKAAHAEEQLAAGHGAAVVGQTGDLRMRARAEITGGCCQAGGQLVEPHGLMLSRRDAEIREREAHDLPERRRRDGSAENRPGLRFVDDHRASAASGPKPAQSP